MLIDETFESVRDRASRIEARRAALIALALVAVLLLIAAGRFLLSPPPDVLLIERASASDSAKDSSRGERGSADAEDGDVVSESSEGDAGEDAYGASSNKRARIWVHVSGAVRNPGVYELPAGSRVHRALEAAGGFSEEAASCGVNLARVLTDGEQVHVPGADDPPLTPEAGGPTGLAAGGQAAPVNVNTASEEALQQLPGVGPALAKRIVEYRRQHGPFARIEDLRGVSGVGDKVLARMRPRATV
ncbi:ComEA family DNA-binding protein [Eggerthellaceae bacterium zg-1084]|uniref:ComEA family DNA-binding protein n=1 Tax=Berryella wangjianweii TaxID=2734634 RepID=A0A6M8J0E7_9ACTN|nr:ComEA family DNA-binding protein [Berryella wangjianweii]NPD30322.1 ComEA family DNA-binding protein [Berryella wangjianweii]QKF07004.1 ComEA family DNA-binding protein [Berryella wangjianweii]